MDFSKATDYELVKELARRVDEYSLNGVFVENYNEKG